MIGDKEKVKARTIASELPLRSIVIVERDTIYTFAAPSISGSIEVLWTVHKEVPIFEESDKLATLIIRGDDAGAKPEVFL